ncbi:MAG: ABC transporter substrate-binding protein [Nitrososphaeria archaeon]
MYNSTGSVSSNSSLILVTINPSIKASPSQINGPIAVQASSSGVNQTIPLHGWVNLTYGGALSSPPITVGSQVPTDTGYTVQSFKWTIDNSSTIKDNNTGIRETVNLTFNTAGLHIVDLITTTSNSTTGATSIGQYMMTIAVGNYSIEKITPNHKITVNTNEIVDAEWSPGGTATLDPALNYISYELFESVYQYLVFYGSGTSSTVWEPVLATNVPSLSNGEIVYLPNGAANYTFYLNTSLQYSNGDHVSAYDVFASYSRVLLFANDAGAPGWILAHALLPAPSIYGPFNESYYWIHHAMTWNNTTQSITFHLLPSVPTWLPNTSAVYAGQSYGILNQSYPVTNYGSSTTFLELIGSAGLASVIDWKWLSENGALPANNSAAYAAFANTTSGPGVLGNWNTKVEYGMMGTGPYELALYEPAQEIILEKNPYYHQTAGPFSLPPSKIIPKVVIEYLSNQAQALQQIESGEAQFAEGAFTVDTTSLAQKLIKEGIIKSVTAPYLADFGFEYNFWINITGAQSYDKSTNIPSTFFANWDVRKAFSYAFNYTYQIDVANTNSGVTYAMNLSGIIPMGMPEYTANLSVNYPETTNYTLASYYWNQSPYSAPGAKWYLPMFNYLGNPTDDQMLEEFASEVSKVTHGQVALQLVDVNFNTLAEYQSLVNGSNPMPISTMIWEVDYADASDFVAPLLQEHGFPMSNGIVPWNPYFVNNKSAASIDELQNITQMWNFANMAEQSTNFTTVVNDYYRAQVIAIKLMMYFGVEQPLNVVYYSSYISTSSLTLMLNPVIAGTNVLFGDIQYVTS